VTYLLFYRGFRARVSGATLSSATRARYVAAGILAPAALVAWSGFALATGSARALGSLVQLMFLLVGWHYAKQGFGVLVVLSARRGVRFTGRERIALLAHVLSGWAYAWASPADPGTEVEEKGIVYTTIAHSITLERITHVAFLASAAPLAFVLLQKWRRESRLPIGTPLFAFLCTIWSWTIYSSADPLVRYAIPALHSVQYLYFVWLLRDSEAKEREGPPFFEARLTRLGWLAASALGLGWLFFHGAPAVLDGAWAPRHGAHGAARPLGPTPWFASIFAVVNLHHYLMDQVIWRRDNPETRYLTRTST
jgi:hypothetical protein